MGKLEFVVVYFFGWFYFALVLWLFIGNSVIFGYFMVNEYFWYFFKCKQMVLLRKMCIFILVFFVDGLFF
uniref:ATP synthase F0 subunit 8 n=1 Tax=Panagrolaimus sp. PS1159 TaxID=55785 RepID=A0AC35G8M7_9BILA